MPFVIGLTGGIGCGKSSAADIFRELGVPVVDTDEIAHHLTATGQSGVSEIRDQFGAKYLHANGALDRARMRTLIFADAAARRKLTAILHPLIRAEVVAAIKKVTAPYVVVMVPLLVETGDYNNLVQRVLVIDCDESLQIARAARRDKLAENEVRAIIDVQATRSARLAQADDIVHNDSDLPTLRAEIVALHPKYLEFANSSRRP